MWLHLQSKKRKFTRESLARLRDEYWNLPPSKIAELKQLGSAATVATLPSFSERAQRSRATKAVGPAAPQRRTKNVALAGKFSDMLASFLSQGCVVDDMQACRGAPVDAAGSLADPWIWNGEGGDLNDILRLFSQWSRLERRQRAAEKEEAPTLSEEETKAAAERLLMQRLGLAEMSGATTWRSFPHTCHELSSIWSAPNMPDVDVSSVSPKAQAWESRHVGVAKSSWPRSNDDMAGAPKHARLSPGWLLSLQRTGIEAGSLSWQGLGIFPSSCSRAVAKRPCPRSSHTSLPKCYGDWR